MCSMSLMWFIFLIIIFDLKLNFKILQKGWICYL